MARSEGRETAVTAQEGGQRSTPVGLHGEVRSMVVKLCVRRTRVVPNRKANPGNVPIRDNNTEGAADAQVFPNLCHTPGARDHPEIKPCRVQPAVRRNEECGMLPT